MSNDHYAICETNKKYCYLGEFYEYDVRTQQDIQRRMNGEIHQDRLNNGPGVMYMLKLCAFMGRNSPSPVRVINENEFFDLQELNDKWVEDDP